MDDFRLVADDVEADIRSGRLRPGERLLPQREFARRRGMAVSTAARVYQELTRRGLTAGEIGRGTFVLGEAGPPTVEHGPAMIDLEANFPVLAEQVPMLARSIARVLEPSALTAVLNPVPVYATAEARAVGAGFLGRGGWQPEADRMLFTGSGRQSIAAALVTLARPGQRLGVEELTYPVVKSIAARHGVTLVPIEMDEHGLSPSALAETHRHTPLAAVYVQPTLHNPLGTTMPAQRRAELGACLADLGLVAIEDGINSFLDDEALPLAAYAPQQTIGVDSLSKRVGAGLNLGFVHGPARLTEPLAAAIRSWTWTAPGLALACAVTVLADGTAERIIRLKQRDAVFRHAIAGEVLAEFDLQSDPRAYHVWWRLPGKWTSDAFTSAAARLGIVISPASDFAVAPAPEAVRLSLSSPDPVALRRSLELLAGVARTIPSEVGAAY
ncbi:DNA-binding transcriptional MocR family regulator [Allocatelliglobosispora scoriae]|uniref:DNA-binding transcriptional MocR family regulator n=1 Tax=Allocatelliglobosispora scoriae TaxID=643052 RepID=A0A841BJL9_9ACTN|nr:PLP-dependent aminotransferase family protein [Allocatelliglobosispora scoriae]MBB5868454.1 DNA-binding transcriptional MocR family regulator [Allocatelliglobosispora scoriae]